MSRFLGHVFRPRARLRRLGETYFPEMEWQDLHRMEVSESGENRRGRSSEEEEEEAEPGALRKKEA